VYRPTSILLYYEDVFDFRCHNLTDVCGHILGLQRREKLVAIKQAENN